jgi:hypothetical protein
VAGGLSRAPDDDEVLFLSGGEGRQQRMLLLKNRGETGNIADCITLLDKSCRIAEIQPKIMGYLPQEYIFIAPVYVFQGISTAVFELICANRLWHICDLLIKGFMAASSMIL